MNRFITYSLLICILGLLGACQTTDLNSVSTGEQNIKAPVQAIPVDVPLVISQQAIEPLAATTPPIRNLFTNGGFESGLEGWTACASGGIKLSNDSYDGSAALEIVPGNCFYRSVAVNPGQDLVLSCYARLQSGNGWTGMGLGFADASWTTIPGGPSTIITGNSYQRYDVEATAPEGTKYVSMWMYSDNPAVVDDCSLMLEQEPPPPPPPSGDNLLENPSFNGVAPQAELQINAWSIGCGGDVSMTPAGTRATSLDVVLENGACLDQSLSASDISVLKGQDYTYACSVKNTGGYASMSIFLDGTPKSVVIPSTSTTEFTRITIIDTAENNISSGFVSLYAEGESLVVASCSLTVDGGEPPPPPPPSGDNLLDNGNFESVTNLKPNNWSKGCGGTWSSTTANGRGLALGGGACVDQSLSTADIAAISGQTYVYSCYAKNVSGYASISIFLDGEQKSKAIPVGNNLELVEITGQAGQVSSGFVSIYSEGDLVIDDCSLTVEGSGPVGTPSIDVRNQVDGNDSYASQGPFTFEIAVRNNGDVALENVSLTSDELSCDVDFPSLAVGEIKMTTCTSDTIINVTTGPFTHTVTATATTADGRVVTDSDAASYTLSFRATPRGYIDITTDNRFVPAGSDVTFFVTVANAGNVSGISEIESNIADCTRQYTPALVSGDIQSYQCVATNVQESFEASVNVVSEGAYTISAQDSINIAIENSVAIDIAVGKEGADAYGIFGDENPHMFEVKIKNIGAKDFTTIDLVSDTVADCSRTIGNLAIGETTSYTCISPFLSSGQILKNTVTATAQSSDGAQDSDVDSLEIYPQEDLSLDIRIGNEGSDEITVASGSDVDVTLIVSNTGIVDITEIWEAFIYVTNAPGFEPICQDVTPYANPNETDRVPFNLAAGESKSFTCTLENVTEFQRVQATFAHLDDRSGQKRDTDVLVIRVIN